MGLIRLKKMSPLVEEMTQLATNLTNSSTKKEQLDLLMTIKNKTRYLSEKIKSDEIKSTTIENGINELNQLINSSLNVLRGKVQEERRLAVVEAEMAAESVRRETEDKRRAEEDDARRRRADIESRRVQEQMAVAAAGISLSPQKSGPTMTTSGATKTNPNTRKMVDSGCQYEPPPGSESEAWAAEATRQQQEKQDYELAIRLARESGHAFADHVIATGVSPPSLPRSASIIAARQEAANKKHDLSKWKYSELRDTINTSCDIELLESCREEFHRRLKVYHEWKTKNASTAKVAATDTMGDEERAPHSVMQHAGQLGILNGRHRDRSDTAEARYFRIPFVRPSVITGQKGWWFAHFQGQWIARQMELHPEKPSILLVAGKTTYLVNIIHLERGVVKKLMKYMHWVSI